MLSVCIHGCVDCIYILQNKYISIYVFLFLCFIFFPHPVERSKLHYTSLLSRSSLCRPSILQCDHCEHNLKKTRQLFHHQLYVIREKLPLSSSYWLERYFYKIRSRLHKMALCVQQVGTGLLSEHEQNDGPADDEEDDGEETETKEGTEERIYRITTKRELKYCA